MIAASRSRLGLRSACLLSCVFLAAAARAGETARPPALEDALRNPDLGAVYEELIAGLGSAEWAVFTMKVLLEREGMASAVEDFDALALACAQKHRGENPGPAGDAFLASGEGSAWIGDCAFEPGGPAEKVERQARVQMASSEIGLAGALLSREGAATVLAKSGELSPATVAGLEEWLRGRLSDLADYVRCGVSAAAAKVGHGEIAGLSDLYGQALYAALEACPLAEPRTLPEAVAAEPRLPFDAYGRILGFLDGFEEGFPDQAKWVAAAAAATAAASPASWQQAHGVKEIEIVCSREFRARNPAKTAQDYEAFIGSPAGYEFMDACGNRLLADPQHGAARREAVVATVEVGATLARIITAMPVLAEEMGLAADELEDVPEELSARALRHARLWVPYNACLARELFAAIGFELAIQSARPAEAEPAFRERLAAVVQKKSCVPTDGTFESSGTVFDPESAALGSYAKRFGSAAWARLLLGLAIGQDEELLALLAAETRITIRCGAAHRREHPGLSLNEYQAVLQSEAGRQALIGCMARAADDPVQGEADRQAILAANATRLTLATLFSRAKEIGGADLGAIPRLSEEERARLAEEARRLRKTNRCALQQAARTVPLEDLIIGQPAAKAAVKTASESVACSPGAAGSG